MNANIDGQTKELGFALEFGAIDWTKVEEIGHYVTDADDCTRDFQDWAFNVAGALL